VWSWQLTNEWPVHSPRPLEEDADQVRGIVDSDHSGQCRSSVERTKRVLKRCPVTCLGTACCMRRPGEWARWGSESTENYSRSPQAFALVSKAVFRNCLTVIHSKTRTKELPSCHNVTAYLHNAFIKFITEIRQAIEVSPWFDRRNHALTLTIRMPLVRSQSQPIHGPPTQQRLATLAWPATGSR